MGGTKRLMDVDDDSYGTDSSVYYRFLDAELPPERVKGIASAKVVEKLAEIVAAVQGAGRSCSYEEVRKQYVALHKLLNERGHIAPRFRPTLRGPKGWGAARTPEHNLISNDHQVLDLHWLSTEGSVSDRELPPRWRGLFRDGIDHDLASRFAGTAGSAEKKADILALSVGQQLELRSLQTDAVRKWWDREQAVHRRVRIAVMCEARKIPNLRDKHLLWADGWQATRCADYAGGSGPFWYERITGMSIAPSTLSYIKKRVPKLEEYRRTAPAGED